MARLYTCGFELQSKTAGVEFTTVSDASSYLSIDTTTHRTGAASLRVHPTTAVVAYVEQPFVSANANGPFYARVYVNIAAAPSARTTLITINESGTAPKMSIDLQTDRTLQMYGGNDWIQFGKRTAVLSLNKWYRLELSFFYNTVTGNMEMAGYYALEDEAPILIAKSLTERRFPAGAYSCRVGCTVAIATFDAYFDDWAINDSTGSYQNTFPGPGHVSHFKPTGAGDLNTWQKSGGGAGDADNYNQVYETTPDNASTYLKRIATTIKNDDYNVTDPVDAGIDNANIVVNAVQVRIRGGATSATASTARDVRLRLRKTTGGTVAKTGTSVNRLNISGWLTDSTVLPQIPRALISGSYDCTYVDPDGVAWAYPTLLSMQIGCENQTSSTTEVRMSTMWACVDWAPRPASAKARIVIDKKRYTKYFKATLPTDAALLTTNFVQADYDNVATKDTNRVNQEINEYGIFLFKVQSDIGSPSQATITWNGRSAIASTSKTVYLQAYNTSTGWQALDSDNATAADTDIDLSGVITDIAGYTDADGWISCRVYQEDIDV
jgi:hypothetical protein